MPNAPPRWRRASPRSPNASTRSRTAPRAAHPRRPRRRPWPRRNAAAIAQAAIAHAPIESRQSPNTCCARSARVSPRSRACSKRRSTRHRRPPPRRPDAHRAAASRACPHCRSAARFCYSCRPFLPHAPMTVRTRFAPSPTGFLHIGGARTALYCWLESRHRGGQFILRIEDTDRERSTEAAVQAILDGMAWLGLSYDEGPFYQTLRMDRYLKVADDLVRAGKAYYAYETKN